MNKLVYNSIITLVLAVFTFSISFSQLDSLNYGVGLWKKHDSLIQLKKYEYSFLHLRLGYDYQIRGGADKKKLYNEFKIKERNLDSLMACYLTDSMKCVYCVENGIEAFGKQDYSQTNLWFDKAKKYCNNSDYFTSSLNKIIQSVPTDTIFLSTSNNGSLQLLNKRNQLFYSPNFSKDDTLYRRKDTSFYNGIIIQKRIVTDYSDGFYSIIQVKEGKKASTIKHLICRGENDKMAYDSTQRKVLSKFEDGHFYCGTVLEENNRTIHLYPNGDTLSKAINNEDFREYISYHPSGDTSVLKVANITDTNAIKNEIKEWDQNKNLILHSIYFNSKDNLRSLSAQSVTFKENGDTLTLYSTINGVLNGIQINHIPSFNGEKKYRLNTLFQNDTLVSILNSDILYLNKRLKPISEAEFLTLITQNENSWFSDIDWYIHALDKTYHINEHEYNAIGYIGDIWYSKKQKRILKKLSRWK